MKLLFDQNISFRLVKKIQNIFPGSVQVREIELENVSDKEIWEYAKKNSYSIVTFDSDFGALATLYGHPPKVVWLRMGNISIDALISYLENKAEIITDFLALPENAAIACLELE